jgi:polar amino acid transport system substrate-binding protein
MKIIFIISITLFVLTGWGHAEDLRVCIDPYPPFKIVDSSGKVTGGIDIELTNALLGAMGEKAKYTVLPWARCLQTLKYGQSDFVSGITKNTERQKYLYYIEPPYKTNSVKVFYVNKGDETKFKTYEDIKNSTVGILRKAKYFEKFDNDSDIKKYEISNEVSGFKMLKKKRLDAFITTEEVGDYIIETNGYSNDFGKAEYRYSQKVAVYFALSKKSKFAERLPEFEEIVKKLKEQGFFEKKDASNQTLNTDS